MRSMALALLTAFVFSAPFFSAPSAFSAPTTAESALALKLDIDHQDVSQLRLEVWSADGEALYDSGPVAGPSLEIRDENLGERFLDRGLRYELRAWDSAGELVLSQLSTLSGGDEIFSIDFETIPAGAHLEGGQAITLVGDVDVTADLDVAGNLNVSNILDAFAIDVGQLRDSAGGPFFGSCDSGSSIRAIFPNGAVTCEPDDVSVGGGDDLGNHQATQNIVFRDVEEGPVSADGARLLTGPLGETWFAQPGSASAARFGVKDLAGTPGFVIDRNGIANLGAFGPDAAAGDDAIAFGSDGNAFFQLAGPGTPYIDFANDLATDFDMRILLSGDNSLTFDGGRLGVGGMMTNPQFKVDLPNIANQDGQGRANAWMTYTPGPAQRNASAVPDALEKIGRLRGVEFEWSEEQGGGRGLGFVAEELATVLPHLVSWHESGAAQAVNLSGVIPVLVEALKEQQALLEAQQERLGLLETALCSSAIGPGC